MGTVLLIDVHCVNARLGYYIGYDVIEKAWRIQRPDGTITDTRFKRKDNAIRAAEKAIMTIVRFKEQKYQRALPHDSFEYDMPPKYSNTELPVDVAIKTGKTASLEQIEWEE